MVAEELEGFFEVVVLGKAAQGDVDRRLELVLVGLDDVGEDAALGGFVDEVLVSCVEDEDDRAGGVADDLLDQLERVLGALAEPDERDVGMFLAGQLDDLLDVQFLPDDLVAERAGDLRDGLGPLGALLATSTCSSGRSGHWSAWDGLLDAEVNRQRLDAIGRLVDEGKLRPQIEAVLPFEQVREAPERVGGRHTRGKVVLQIG
jgi:hypothetical protein